MDDVKFTIILFLRSQFAESGPPLGTVLGNLGVNTVKFCKDFNDFTSDLPSYFLLKVKIFITESKTYSFFVFLPSTGFLIGLLKFERVIRSSGFEVKQSCITLKSLIQLTLLKFPQVDLKISLKTICGSIISNNLLIV